MITIVDKYTGEVKCSSIVALDLKDNEIAVTEVLTEDFVKPYFDFENRAFYEADKPSEEELALRTRRNSILQIKEKYEQHRVNGWNAYQEFRAMIVLDIHAGLISETQAFLIENDLKVAYDRISQNGDWKTAYYELSQKKVSYPFIQRYMDIALQFIGNYIQLNYDS